MAATERDFIVASDNFARLYYHLAAGLCSGFGLAGEAALRRGIRRYGRERGLTMRARHLAMDWPINLQTLFNNYDFPYDPRFKRNTIELTGEARISETLVCPLAATWLKREHGAVYGQIYCEEIHHAVFSGYDPAVQTNINQTITRGADCCQFAVFLRPANRIAPEHVVQRYMVDTYVNDETSRAIDLMVALSTYLGREYIDRFGDEGADAFRRAVVAFGTERGRALRTTHEQGGPAPGLDSYARFPDQADHVLTRREILELSPTRYLARATRCGRCEGWRTRGSTDIARLYCHAIDDAMARGYDAGFRARVLTCLATGDSECMLMVTVED